MKYELKGEGKEGRKETENEEKRRKDRKKGEMERGTQGSKRDRD